MSEKATYFNEREHQICLVARMVEDARTYWVAGGGSPMAAILLAKKLYAPNAVYVTEDGVVNPEPMLPLDPIMTMVSARSSRGRSQHEPMRARTPIPSPMCSHLWSGLPPQVEATPIKSLT